MKNLLKSLSVLFVSAGVFAQPAYTSTNQNLSGANIVRIDSDPSADRSQPLADQSNISVGSVSAEIATKAGVFFRLLSTHMADVSSIDRTDFSDINTVGDQAGVYLGKMHPLTIASHANNVWAPGFTEFDPACAKLKGRYNGTDYVIGSGDVVAETPLVRNVRGSDFTIYNVSGTVGSSVLSQGFGCEYIDEGTDVKIKIRFHAGLMYDQYSGPPGRFSIELVDNGATFSKSHRITRVTMGYWGSNAIDGLDEPVTRQDFFDTPGLGKYDSVFTNANVEEDGFVHLIFEAEFSLQELIEMTQTGASMEDVYASAVSEFQVNWRYTNI